MQEEMQEEFLELGTTDPWKCMLNGCSGKHTAWFLSFLNQIIQVQINFLKELVSAQHQ